MNRLQDKNTADFGVLKSNLLIFYNVKRNDGSRKSFTEAGFSDIVLQWPILNPTDLLS